MTAASPSWRDRALDRIKAWVIHPLLLPLYPVLSLYLSNLGEEFSSQAAPILGGIFVLALVSWFIAYKLIKDRNTSALLVSAFFVLFFSFGYALSTLRIALEWLNLLDTLWFILYARHARLIWAALWMALFAGVAFVIIRQKRAFEDLTRFLNFIAVTLLVIAAGNYIVSGGIEYDMMPGIQELRSEIRQRMLAYQARRQPQKEYRMYIPIAGYSDPHGPSAVQSFDEVWLSDLPRPTTTAHPDIYYIIPDMYIRSDYLSALYQCDTSDFLAALEARGFYIARESRSNYPYTTHSLASSLNFMYLNDIVEQVGQIREHYLSIQMIEHSRIATFLRSQGYTTVAFSTGFWFTSLEEADVYLEPPASTWTPGEFEAGVIKLTPLSAFSFFGQSRDEAYRRRTLYTLEHIPDGAAIDGPTFVFAHILAPHDPYVFDAYGEPVLSQEEYTEAAYREAYCDQARYISRRLQEVADEILARSPEPPIIIIQGDHGAMYGTDYVPHINERMSILNAYYFPDQNYEDLYPGITPVNTFRVVLNTYFGAAYPLLDDISYYNPPETPYDFENVTQEVINGAPGE